MLEFDLSELLEEDSSVSSNYVSENTTRIESKTTPKTVLPVELPVVHVLSPCEIQLVWENPTTSSYLTKSGEVRNGTAYNVPENSTSEEVVQALNATLCKNKKLPLDRIVKVYIAKGQEVSGKKPMLTKKGSISPNSMYYQADTNYNRASEGKRSTKSNSSIGGNMKNFTYKPENVEVTLFEQVRDFTKQESNSNHFVARAVIFCSPVNRIGYYLDEKALKAFHSKVDPKFEELIERESQKGEIRITTFFRLFPEAEYLTYLKKLEYEEELAFINPNSIESIWVDGECYYRKNKKNQTDEQKSEQATISQRSTNNVKNSLVHNISTVLTNKKSQPFCIKKVPNMAFKYWLKDSQSLFLLCTSVDTTQLNYQNHSILPITVTNTSEDDWAMIGLIGKIKIQIKPRKLPRFIKYMNHSPMYLHILNAINKHEKNEPVNQDWFLNFFSPDYAKLNKIGCIESAVESEGKWYIRVKNQAKELIFIRGISSEVKDDLSKSLYKYGLMTKTDKLIESGNEYMFEVWNHLSTWFNKLPNYYFHDNCATSESVKKYNAPAANVRKSCLKLLNKCLDEGLITDKFGNRLTELNCQLLVDNLDDNWFRFSEDEFWTSRIKSSIDYNPKYKLEPDLFFRTFKWKDLEKWAKFSSKLVYMLTGYELNFIHNGIVYNHKNYSKLTNWISTVYSSIPNDKLPKKNATLGKLYKQITELATRKYTVAMGLESTKLLLDDKLLEQPIEKFI